MVETLMTITNLKKHFLLKQNLFAKNKIVKAVDDVNLEIPRESIYAIVGESGSGKTTLGRTILRLIPPTAGSVKIEGKDVLTLDKKEFMPYRRKMQIVFQDPYNSLHPRKLVKTVIGEGLKIHFKGISEMEIRDKIREVLVQVGLREEHMFRYPHEFSGGQRQRIAFARAIVLEPEFIVLDEPTSALDVSVQAMVLKMLQEARAQNALTYLFITHNLSIVDYFANHLAVMYLGRVVEAGSKAEIFDHPAHPYTRLLMSSNPIPDPFLNREKQVARGEIPSPINPPSGCHFHPRCPLAKPECKETEPPYRELAPGHHIRCHYPM
ncbi:MAG TPA: ATP-binding cassette domain-containing protein [Thermotogota bacterium]|nr:ATP-binding cassette domain-containing protein [Thermotogota bacterium]HOF24520.1 ATP-binding cassette domain-containing protein [Thermotogota bacterium]HOS25761.1 ATP-binding cassette domain-containing protein [Thermotogota bacterium]HOT87239.1 ATP-binding cassette domain-containing protein [Thermotogota bacterium]HPD36611.1 ATP-binding cassette domain-containing protein [Thermotogota bacterium]